MYYPKLKERPPNFRINRGVGHPLAKGCILAMLGRFPGTAAAHDSSAYRNDGVLTGMDPPTDWVYQPELGRQAVETNGSSSQYVDFGDKPIWYLSKYTWCGWFRGVSNAVQGAITQPLINGTDRFTFSWDHSTSIYIKSIVHKASDKYYTAKLTSDLLAHTWYHVCGTYDGVYLRAWLNGANEATVSAPPPVSNTGMLFISRPVRPWPGRVADIFIFDHALSVYEISALADPDNVDLRIGGVPLILPPKRVWWPATTAPIATKKTPWHLMIQGAI